MPGLSTYESCCLWLFPSLSGQLSSQSLVLMWIGVLSFLFFPTQGYMTNGEEKTDDVPVKQAPDSKPVCVMRVTKRSTVSDLSCFCDMWLWLAGRSESSNERVAIQVIAKGTKPSLSFPLVVADARYCLSNTCVNCTVWVFFTLPWCCFTFKNDRIFNKTITQNISLAAQIENNLLV